MARDNGARWILANDDDAGDAAAMVRVLAATGPLDADIARVLGLWSSGPESRRRAVLTAIEALACEAG